MVAATDLLKVWEEGLGRSPVERSLLAFALARPDASADELMDAGIGERDRSLIRLRCALFGATADAVADCPSCGERLDITVDLRDLLLPPSEKPLLSVRDLLEAPPVPSAFREHLLSRAGVEDPVAIEEADPQANLQFDLVCAECGYAWSETFDIGGFFWTELEDLAIRTLQDVHTLASAYGWSEEQILALSPVRRTLYLSMAGGGL